MLELAWCVNSALDGEEPQLISYLLEQPEDEPVPFQIQRLTGITGDEMEGAVCPSIAFEDLQTAIEALPQPKLSVIHYARFETPFFIDLFECYGGGATIPFQTICTFEIARRLYPNLPSRGIRALGGFLGLDMEEVKRSLSHVEATVTIWRHLVEKLDSNGIKSLAELDEFLAAPAKVKRTKLEYPLERLKRLNLPDKPGVYRMLNRSGRVLYVGKATSLKSRVNSHFRGRRRKTSKSFELLTQVDEINFTACASPLEAALLESDEIKKFDPPYNTSLKAGTRTLSYYSRDLVSVSLQPDTVHVIGPMPNPYSMETLVRLSDGIESGVIDRGVLWNPVEPEVLVDGLQIFFENHGITVGERITPRQLLGLGMRMFRATRRELRRQAAEAQRAKLERERLELENAARIAEGSTTEGAELVAEMVNDVVAEHEIDSTENAGDDSDGDDDEMTPEEVAERIDSTLISIARSYLVAKELTSLLHCDIEYGYQSVRRNLYVRNSCVFLDSQAANEAHTVSSWTRLDIKEYDRMRVLLTDLVKMMDTAETVSVVPRLRILSCW